MRLHKKLIIFIITVFLTMNLFAFSSFAMSSGGKIVVVLDPGHGGKETGTCAGNCYESVYTLDLANEIKKNLDADGRFETYLTRTGDVAMTKLERCLFANDYNADVCISIHFDGNDSSELHGVSGYVSVVPKFQKKTLAISILDKLSKATGIDVYDRGEKGVQAIEDKGSKIYYWSDELNWSFADPSVGSQKRDYYGMPKWGAYLGVPTMIIEHGFLTNPYDRSIIESTGTFETMGKAEADAIIEYYTGHTHSFGEISTDYPSNCLFVGKQSQKCVVCGARKNVTNLPGENDKHYWVKSKTVSADCGKDGYIEYICEFSAATGSNDEGKDGFCSVHTKREIIPALEHDYAVVSHTEAGHGVDGKTVYICRNCGDKYTDIVKGEAHNYVFSEKTELDCTHDESNIYVCTICGDKKTEVIKKANGHQKTNLIEVLPTCTEWGHNDFTCSVCGEHIVEDVEPKGHSFEIIGTDDGDCQTFGSITERCSVCGEEKVTVNTLYGQHRPQKNDDGTFSCSVCGETLTANNSENEENEENITGENNQVASIFTDNELIVFAGAVIILSAAVAFVIKKYVFDRLKTPEETEAVTREPQTQEQKEEQNV